MGARYLLDTDICIYIAKHRPSGVRERFSRHAAGYLAMSLITLGELHVGAEKSQARGQAISKVEELASLIAVHPLPEAAGEHYGRIRASSQRMGHPIGNNDLWITSCPCCGLRCGHQQRTRIQPDT